MTKRSQSTLTPDDTVTLLCLSLLCLFSNDGLSSQLAPAMSQTKFEDHSHVKDDLNFALLLEAWTVEAQWVSLPLGDLNS